MTGPGARPAAVLLVAALLAGACASGQASGQPPASSAIAPGSPGAASTVPVVAGSELSQEVLDALADPSRQRLAAVGEAFDAAVDERTGLVAALGEGLVAWLTDQRSAAATAALRKAGIDPSAGSPRHLATARLAAARLAAAGGGDLAFGQVWVGTIITMPLLLQSGIGNVGQESGSAPIEPTTSTEERTENGIRVTSTTTVTLQLQLAGDMVIADADATQDVAAFDASTGAARGTAAHRSHLHAEIKVCPDASGQVVLNLTIDMTSANNGMPDGGGSFTAHATDELRGQVGDDAWLSSTTESSIMDYTATDPNGTTQTGSGTRTISQSHPAGGGSSQITGAAVTVGAGSMSPEESLKWQNVLYMTSMIVTQQSFGAAQKVWRTSGKCVKVVSTETGRNVAPDEIVHFEAKPFHVIEGVDLDKPIVATLAGEKTVLPPGQEQDPPAPITYVAPAQAGHDGTVTLTSTSNRGIGTLNVHFTVVSQVVVELGIDSRITVTKLSGLGVVHGLARADGRIRLERGSAEGTWAGSGTLNSTTTSTPGGCSTVHISGTGVYDWVVNEVVISPGITAGDVVANMDAGTIVENPDKAIANLCRTTATSKLNTWENLFFVVHAKEDFKANGFRVEHWTLLGTQDTWKTGGLLAEAKWSGSCPSDGINAVIAGCAEKTTFRLYAVVLP